MRYASPHPTLASLLLIALLGAAAPGLHATELVYVPVNPAFGGSPLNGSVLLNAAQSFNKHKDPEDQLRNNALTKKTPLEEFNELLERAILSRIATGLTSSVVGANGQLIPGTVETGNFNIQISDLGGGLLRITTTDKATGSSTFFEVGQ